MEAEAEDGVAEEIVPGDASIRDRNSFTVACCAVVTVYCILGIAAEHPQELRIASKKNSVFKPSF